MAKCFFFLCSALRNMARDMRRPMKKIILTLAIAGLAASPLVAQPRNRAPAPLPGAHDTAGELVLYGAANFSGQSQTIRADSPSVSTPFPFHAPLKLLQARDFGSCIGGANSCDVGRTAIVTRK